MKVLLETKNAGVVTDEKRTIVHDLNMSLSQKERVAIIGRNGVGKSTLLDVFCGQRSCESGKVILHTTPYMVKQQLDVTQISCVLQQLRKYPAHIVTRELQAIGLPSLDKLTLRQNASHGELRKMKLVIAKLQKPQLVTLDEPTQDLDTHGIVWLRSWLSSQQEAVIVVSHDREILQGFQDFFIVAESGCRYFHGTFTELQRMLDKEYTAAQQHYLRSLHNMVKKEQHVHHISRRKARKKRYGRISELDRATPRQTLNQKRSDAQCQHGKAKKIREQRMHTLRSWTKDTRRALHVELPLIVPQIDMASQDTCATIDLDDVSVYFDDRCVIPPTSLTQRRERTAIVGTNGSGKTTLLRVMTKEIKPQQGVVTSITERIGYIAQNANNWKINASLWQQISRCVDSLQKATQILVAHKFPLALAKRPLSSLSPGERVRAALICLFHKQPQIELLILDEPNTQLDFVGQQSLIRALQAWCGGLVIASHDQTFLKQLKLDRILRL